MKIGDILIDDPLTVSPEDSVSTAINKMKEANIYELPVTDNKKLVGYFDYRTLVRRRNISLYTKVEHVMLHPPKIYQTDNINDVINKMLETGFKTLPIINKKNSLIGIINRRDIINLILDIEEYREQPIVEIMNEDPITVRDTDTTDKAITSMKNLSELNLPVIDKNEKLKGSIYLRDITQIVWRDRHRQTKGEKSGEKEHIDLSIQSIIKPACRVSKDSNLGDAIREMKNKNSQTCVIVENDIPIGIISQKDILELIGKKEHSGEVFVQITGLEIDDPEPYDFIYDRVDKFLKKIAKLEGLKLQSLIFHIEEYQVRKYEMIYNISTRLITDKKLYLSNSKDRNLYRAVDDVLEKFDIQLIKEKDKKLSKRKQAS